MLRIQSDDDRQGHQRPRPRRLPPRRRPGRDAVELAGRGARRPRRSPPARTRLYRLHPPTGTYDLYDDTRSQVYRGVEVETAATNAAITATAGRGPEERLVDRERAVPLDRRRRDREQRERLRVGHRHDRGGRRARTCGGRPIARRTGRRTTRPSPYATWQTATYTPDELSAIFANADPRTTVGTIAHARPVAAGRVGPADQRDADGRARDEDRVGRRVPGRLQRRHQPAGRSGDAEHALRHPPDPLIAARDGNLTRLDRSDRYGPGMTIAVLPRCWWAGADGPAGPADDPPTTTTSGACRVTTTSSCSSGSPWSRSRPDCRGRRSCASARGSAPRSMGFDPAVVAAYGPDDRDRLMADAGIVRNRAKIDATIGNAVALLRSRAPRRARSRRVPRPPGPGPAEPTPARRCRRVRSPLSRPSRTRCRPTSSGAASSSSASTIVYAFMQSVGLVDDHLPGCFRYRGGVAPVSWTVMPHPAATPEPNDSAPRTARD